MRVSSCFVILAMLIVACATPTWADMTLDFEAPTYTTGANLVGQDGWEAHGTWPVDQCVVADGSVVNGVQSAHMLAGKTYVSALYDGWFNIEDGDRSSGIVIAASGDGLSLGQEVMVTGVVKTNDFLGERGIYGPLITPLTGSKIIEPLTMTNNALGGGPSGLQAGVLGASGMNNVGLLVKTTGRVSPGLGGEYFALDDGSGVDVIAWYGGTHPGNGTYITATGTVSTFKDVDGNLQRQLILTEFQPVAE